MPKDNRTSQFVLPLCLFLLPGLGNYPLSSWAFVFPATLRHNTTVMELPYLAHPWTKLVPPDPREVPLPCLEGE